MPVLDDVCRAWNPDWTAIEANGFQVWFVKEARDKSRFPSISTVRELEPEDQSKVARASPAIIRAEQGSIYLPYANDTKNPWVGPFEEELYAFSGKEGRPDDQVDTYKAYAIACESRPAPAATRRGSIDENELPFAIGERNRFCENRRF